MNFLLVILLISCASCAAPSMKDLREELSEHNKTLKNPPEPTPDFVDVDDALTPLNPVWELMLSFLDVSGTSNWASLNKKYKFFVDKYTRSCLGKYYSQIFISKNSAVNRKFLALLKQNFGRQNLFGNPLARDALTRTISRLLPDGRDYWSYLILNYLNEMFHGPHESIVGMGSREQNILFLTKLLKGGVTSSMPESCQVYSDSIKNDPEIPEDVKSFCLIHFKAVFLNDSKCRKNMQKLKKDPVFVDLVNENKNRVVIEFAHAINYYSFVTILSSVKDQNEMVKKYPSMLDFVQRTVCSRERFTLGSLLGQYRKALSSSFDLEDLKLDVLKYFWSLSSANSFCKDTLFSLLGREFQTKQLCTIEMSGFTFKIKYSQSIGRITEVFTCPSPNLEQIEMILEITRMLDLSKVLPIEESFIHFLLVRASPIVLNAIFSEHPGPINTFILSKGKIRSIFGLFEINEEKSMIYLKSRARIDNHPIPILFMHHSVIKALVPKLESLFDLDKQIDLDCDLISCIEIESFTILKNQGLEVAKFYGARISFREFLEYKSLESDFDKPEFLNDPVSLGSFIRDTQIIRK